MIKQVVIDAKGGVLGRVASVAAKEALNGNKVIIVNCNEAVVVGSKAVIIEQYMHLRGMGGAGLKGPRILTIPFRFMKRTIRGMLPHFQARGEEALERIMCYNDTPKEFEAAKKMIVVKKLIADSITLKELH